MFVRPRPTGDFAPLRVGFLSYGSALSRRAGPYGDPRSPQRGPPPPSWGYACGGPGDPRLPPRGPRPPRAASRPNAWRRLMRRSPGLSGSEWPDLRVWRSLRCCLDDCKWCAGRAYLDAGEARGGEEFTPFGFGAFLAAHHGEHAQVGDLGQVRGISRWPHEVEHQQPCAAPAGGGDVGQDALGFLVGPVVQHKGREVSVAAGWQGVEEVSADAVGPVFHAAAG